MLRPPRSPASPVRTPLPPGHVGSKAALPYPLNAFPPSWELAGVSQGVGWGHRPVCPSAQALHPLGGPEVNHQLYTLPAPGPYIVWVSSGAGSPPCSVLLHEALQGGPLSVCLCLHTCVHIHVCVHMHRCEYMSYGSVPLRSRMGTVGIDAALRGLPTTVAQGQYLSLPRSKAEHSPALCKAGHPPFLPCFLK